ncbi:hypothetical protein ACM66B_001691 [Microbotryomycetes sp. NB124-2]
MLTSLPASSATALARLCETLFNAADLATQHAQSPPQHPGASHSASHNAATAQATGRVISTRHVGAEPSAKNASGGDAMSPGGSTQRCSQCKKHKPLHEYPTRLATLQPSLICKAHSWYWTQDKVDAHWAPEHLSSVQDICAQATAFIKGRGSTDKWMMQEPSAEQKLQLVQAVAATAGMVASAITTRRSRAVKSKAPETAPYKLTAAQARDGSSFRMSLTSHPDLQKLVIVIKEETSGRSGPWSKRKKDQTDSSKESSATPEVQSTAPTPAPASTSSVTSATQNELTNLQSMRSATSDRATLSSHQTQPPRPAARTPAATRFTESTTAEATRPKKKKRIEPVTRPLPSTHGEFGDLQVFTSGTYDPAAAQTIPPSQQHQQAVLPSQSRTSSSFLVARPPSPTRRRSAPSLPTLLEDSADPNFFANASPNVHQLLSLPSHGPSSSSSSDKVIGLNGPPVFSTRPDVPPMTLADLLASPYTDPPNIPLRQRTMIMNAAAYITASLDQHDRQQHQQQQQQHEREAHQQGPGNASTMRQGLRSSAADGSASFGHGAESARQTLPPPPTRTTRTTVEIKSHDVPIVAVSESEHANQNSGNNKKRKRVGRRRDADLDEWLVRDVTDSSDDEDGGEDGSVYGEQDSILDDVDANEGGRKGFVVDDGQELTPNVEDEDDDESEFESEEEEGDESDEEDDEGDGEDWLTGFVKDQMQSSRDEEVDELDDEA